MSTRQYRVIHKRNSLRAISYIDGERDRESHAWATYQEQPAGWYLEDLYVWEGHRRQGVGRRLVLLLQKTVQNRGSSRIYLLPAGDNAIAIKRLAGWYKRLGFREVQRFSSGESILEWRTR